MNVLFLRETLLRASLAVFLGLVVPSGNLEAAEGEPETPGADLLEKMTTFYRAQEGLSVKSEITVSMTVGGGEGSPVPRAQEKQVMKQELRLRRPDRYALVSEGKATFLSVPSVYLDGEVATVKLEGQGWLRVEGVDGVPELFRHPALGYDERAGGNVLLDQSLALAFLNKLLFAELGRGWKDDLAGIRYVGEEKQGDLDVHHLILSTETRQFGEPALMDLHVWIAKGERPWLMKLEPELSTVFPQAEGEPRMEIGMVSTWSNWEISTEFPEGSFKAPEPGEGEEVFSSFDALMQAQLAAQNPALTLTGTEAEGFTLPKLGGEDFALSSQRGKRVVVLGFWATWLTPESDALEAWAEILRESDEAEVMVLAVSLGEKGETVEAYLKERGVRVPILLDEKQTLVEPYKVRSIPQTVVIGKDGEVKQVHIGVDDAFAGEVLQQLDVLLGAKELGEGTKGIEGGRPE